MQAFKMQLYCKKKRLWRRPVNFVQFLRTCFLLNPSERLFLILKINYIKIFLYIVIKTSKWPQSGINWSKIGDNMSPLKIVSPLRWLWKLFKILGICLGKYLWESYSQTVFFAVLSNFTSDSWNRIILLSFRFYIC